MTTDTKYDYIILLLKEVCAIVAKARQNKVVPLHAMVALGGRGGIAPTHS
jgi:hypothetical protein